MTKISMLRHTNFLYLYTLPHHDFTHPRIYPMLTGAKTPHE
ncbi:MAG: hypothetical protein SPL45_06685 [Schwartzia succinivorans]|nr:hypothetical protein [Schwartzia succinivorans]